MPMQRYKPEQIVTVLRQIEVAMANGKSTPQACKEAGIHISGFVRSEPILSEATTSSMPGRTMGGCCGY